VRKFSYMRFDPEGMTTNPEIPFAKSMPDYIMRWLASRFLDVDVQEELGILTPEVRARKAAQEALMRGDAPEPSGGANGGNGHAIALALAEHGADLALTARNEADLRETADAARAHHGRVEVFVADLARPAEIEAMVDRALGTFGRIDALVNNAGASQARTLEDLTDEDWQAQWDVHVMAPMRLMRAAAPRMAERGAGRIVNVSSSSGKRPSGNLDPPYSVTKAAELSLSRWFADRWAGRGVLVNAVTPGPVEGNAWVAPGGLADQLAARQGSDRDTVLEATASRVPRGRMATEDEIAAVVVFLCSARASNVAGAAWSVDGGSVPIIL
jgi:NAD(P)-dependent dehydrogenase (short-subunit alcohol dehydrogenase family)